jgi:hypothetical protein
MDTQTVITIITGALSFVTMIVVMLVGYIFASTTGKLEKSVSKSHERIDSHIHDNDKRFSDMSKEYVSHPYLNAVIGELKKAG